MATKLKETLQNIADAIREKLSYPKEVYPLQPVNFAEEIRNFPQEGGGGTYADPAELVEGTISSVTNAASYIKPYTFAYCYQLSYADFSQCRSIGSNAFNHATNLAYVSFPEAEILSNYCFSCCSALVSAYFPKCTSILASTFTSCIGLLSADFPVCSTIGTSAFGGCRSLNTISFPNCTNIGSWAFYRCNISSLYLPKCLFISNRAFCANNDLMTVDLPECYYIGSEAFTNCSNINYLSLPKVQYIESSAFDYITNINNQSIDLPMTAVIGSRAFQSASLLHINIPNCSAVYRSAFVNFYGSIQDTYMPNIEYIDEYAFYNINSAGLEDLTEELLPSTLSYIRDFAFGNSVKFRSISLPNLYYLGSMPSGENVSWTLSSLYLPEAVWVISAFNDYSTLRTVNLPKVEYLSSAFANCINLSSVSLPNAHDISGAFRGCIGLSSIDLPACYSVGLRTFENCINLSIIKMSCISGIHSSAFNNCINLEELGWCTSMTGLNVVDTLWIYNHAFCNCSKLSNIVLTNCYSIWSNVFNGCNNLESIFFLSSSCYFSSDGVFANTPIADSSYLGYYGSIYVLSSYLSYYKNLLALSSYSDRICAIDDTMLSGIILPRQFSGSTITEIPLSVRNAAYALGSAFYACSQLSEVSMPELQAIWPNTFGACHNLSKVYAPKLSKINASCFQNCSILSDITLDFSNISQIYSNTFAFCSALTSISFPEVERIDGYAFWQCSNLSNIYLPKLKYLGSHALRDCKNLASISLLQLSYLTPYTFMGCSNLQTVEIPSYIDKIPAYCFEYCSNLSYIPNMSIIKKVDEDAFAFAGISGVVSLELTSKIAAEAFHTCSNITKVILGETYLASYAFYRCINLTEAHLLNVKSAWFNNYIFSGVFNSCTNLSKLYFYGSCVFPRSPFATDFLSGTQIASGNGFIYVRQSLVEAYQTSVGWSSYASYFSGLTDEEFAELKTANYSIL